jgi:hypothetical protein
VQIYTKIPGVLTLLQMGTGPRMCHATERDCVACRCNWPTFTQLGRSQQYFTIVVVCHIAKRNLNHVIEPRHVINLMIFQGTPH